MEPGNNEGLPHSLAVITVCGGYNVRGGGVMVNPCVVAPQVPEVESKQAVHLAPCVTVAGSNRQQSPPVTSIHRELLGKMNPTLRG